MHPSHDNIDGIVNILPTRKKKTIDGAQKMLSVLFIAAIESSHWSVHLVCKQTTDNEPFVNFLLNTS